MTATQAPKPGPLSGDDVKLLVKGDLLLCKTWGVVRFDRFDDSGVRAFVMDLANNQVRLMKPINMAFIGRPDADGWMPWSGGENPVPGQRVEVRLRNGRQYEDYLSEGWAADKTGPEDYWKHGNDPYLQQLEIIAFRLAPTAPVEASGSERAGLLDDLARTRSDLTRALGKDSRHLRVIDCAIQALRPQPSGETEEALARKIRNAIIDRTSIVDGTITDGDLDDAIEEILDLIRPAPVALGGQHSSGEDAAWSWLNRHVECDPADRDYSADEMVDAFMAGAGRYDIWLKALERIAGEQQHRSGYCQTDITVEPALTAEEAQTVARDALSTTPARAEAQDEGAAREPVAWLGGGDYEPTEAMIEAGLDHNHRNNSEANMVASFKSMMVQAEIDGLLNRAHPSPTPAADADRVRIAVEALEPFANAATSAGRNSHNKPNLEREAKSAVSWLDFSRAAKALAALKSTAAKEGGK